MNKRNTILANIFGLWAFGLITGANIGDLILGEPSLPVWVMLAIGVIGSIVMFSGLYKAIR